MDEGLREALPYFRIRADYPLLTDLVQALLLVFVLSLVISSVVRRVRGRRFNWKSFQAATLERGLSASECQLLWDIARLGKLRNPLLLISSLNAFDQQVGNFLNRPANREDQKTASRLTHIRVLLGFHRPPPGQAIRTTRALEPGQTLMVWPAKGGPRGFSQCVVAHCDDHAITAVPLLREDDELFDSLDPGDRIKVRFWRDHDTEYRFRTTILDAVEKTTSILIKHGDELERIQKRDYFRLPVGFDLVLMEGGAEDRLPATSGNLWAASATDLSGGGMSVTTSQQVKADWLVIDPKFSGTFPLAGIRCKVLGQVRRGKDYQVHLEFVDIAPALESQLVRRLFEEQIQRAVA